MASLAAANGEGAADAGISRNLNGQKLGRKGRDTRARIRAAATELIREESDEPVTLSAVARRVSLGMTSLYLYFADLTELIMAVLEPVTATAEQDFIHLLRKRWPDEELHVHCREFVAAYHAHWHKYSRLLHLRNAMADTHDRRVMAQRIEAAQTLIALLVAQMDGDDMSAVSQRAAMASMLMTGLERAATVWTDIVLHDMFDEPPFRNLERFMGPASRLLELGIRDGRSMAENPR